MLAQIIVPGDAFIDLFAISAPEPEISGVFVDETSAERIYVLSRQGVLAAFELTAEELNPIEPPFQAQLGPQEAWVQSSASLGVVAWNAADGSTTYRGLLPPRSTPARDDYWGVQASGDGGTVFFTRGGIESDRPATVSVLFEVGEPLTFDTRSLPTIRSSFTGGYFAVLDAGEATVYGGREPLHSFPASGTIFFEPDGHWIANLSEDAVAVRPPTGAPVILLPRPEAVVLIALEGDYALVVDTKSAHLYGLSEQDPTRALVSAEASDGYRFTSAALHGAADGLPWMALGALRIDVPQMALPDSPAPSASAEVQIRGPETFPPELLDLHAWITGTPRVEWTRQGRLTVFTPERALVSRRRFH